MQSVLIVLVVLLYMKSGGSSRTAQVTAPAAALAGPDMVRLVPHGDARDGAAGGECAMLALPGKWRHGLCSHQHVIQIAVKAIKTVHIRTNPCVDLFSGFGLN